MSRNNKIPFNIRDIVHLSTIAMFLDQTGNTKFDATLDPIADEIMDAFESYSEEELEDELADWISEVTGILVEPSEV